MVVAQAQALSVSCESNISPSLAALQSRHALSDAQLQKVVVALPSVLSYSFESNIGPKLDYLQSTASLSLDDMREQVVRCPAILGYSQALCYRPRLDACRAAGVAPAFVFSTITLPTAAFYARLDRSRTGIVYCQCLATEYVLGMT